MKKTLLVTIDYPPTTGGVANYWSNLAAHMPADSFCVLAPDDENSVRFDKRQDYLIYRRCLFTCKKWRWPKWLPIFMHTKNIIKKENIEKIVVTHVLPVGTVALLMRLLFKVPYVVSMHGLDISYACVSLRKRLLSKLVIRFSDRVIVNSQYTKNLMLKNLCDKCESKTEIIYPCPNIVYKEIADQDLALFKKEHRLEGKKILLTVARLVRRKGQDMVIKSLAKVKESIPNVVYLVVGRGKESQRLKTMVEERNLSEQVLFFDDIENKELPFFYHLADAFIMPSRRLDDGDIEGFGLVYLEANLYHKPAIAGNAGGAPEAVIHNQTGLVVDPEDESSIAAAVIELLSDKEKSRWFGQKGKDRVEQQFCWDKQATKLEKLLS